MELVGAQRGGGGAGAIIALARGPFGTAMRSLETTSERAAAKDTFGALRVPTLSASPPSGAGLTSWGTSSPRSASIRNILAIFSLGPCRILEISGYSQSFNFVRSEKKGGLQDSGA